MLPYGFDINMRNCFNQFFSINAIAKAFIPRQKIFFLSLVNFFNVLYLLPISND